MYTNMPGTRDDKMTDSPLVFDWAPHPNPHHTAGLGGFEAHYAALEGRISDLGRDGVRLNDLDEDLPTEKGVPGWSVVSHDSGYGPRLLRQFWSVFRVVRRPFCADYVAVALVPR